MLSVFNDVTARALVIATHALNSTRGLETSLNGPRGAMAGKTVMDEDNTAS